jgi:uncharacterized protein
MASQATEVLAVAIPLNGPLALLVLQPTPFCNLDCKYCYLPDRDNPARMSFATLEAAFGRITDSTILGNSLSIVWHAGEPFAVPRTWYAEAFTIARQTLPSDLRIEHHFQTNATLVTDAWCDFILLHRVRIGVSIDGPAHLHDLKRLSRRGNGTHSRVLRGIQLLQSAGIDVHAICVLTRQHLDEPDAVFDFFLDQGIREVGFNIEEVDGANQTSSLTNDALEAFQRFFKRILERYQEDPTRISIREINRVVETLLDPKYGTYHGNAQNILFGILSIAWDGSISTFSPELLGIKHKRFHNFQFGNVLVDSLSDVRSNERLLRVNTEIERGTKRCLASCLYFSFCRGGSPSNKLGETDRFDSTTTVFCSMTQKTIVDTVLAALDKDLELASQ